MTSSPYIVVARRDHDFRVVEATTPFPYTNALKEEARWLALEWWGNCFVEKFQGAVGHFCSSAEAGFHLLMLVQRGPVAPDRFVVCLRDDEYRQFGYDPFRAVHHGVSDLTKSFYHARNEDASYINWKSELALHSMDELTDRQRLRYTVAGKHLAQGKSIVIPTNNDSPELRMELDRFTRSLQPELLKKMNICTFTNSPRDHLEHFGPILCGWYSTTKSESFGDVIDSLVPLDGTGSPFTMIRRGTDQPGSE